MHYSAPRFAESVGATATQTAPMMKRILERPTGEQSIVSFFPRSDK
jgi:hypothetical protein